MKPQKLIPMVQFILDIDWMTTKEFCDNYGLPHPYYTGDVKTSADMFRNLDVIKHKMCVEHAKLLNKNITPDLLLYNLGCESLDARGGNPRYKKDTYEIKQDEFGFWLESDGYRVHKLNDLANLGLTYNQ